MIKLVEHCLCNIPEVTDKNISYIVQEPAAVEGIHFEGELASLIVDDAMRSAAEAVEARRKRHSAVLPSLSFCLQELWEKRVDNSLTFHSYQSLGGVFGHSPRLRIKHIMLSLKHSNESPDVSLPIWSPWGMTRLVVLIVACEEHFLHFVVMRARGQMFMR